jgi:prepilin-type N-terminal cleavage/methylation domain-containing protein
MKGKKGFTLVEIMIVVAIIGLLAAIAIPSFIKARQESQKNACINNLRQIDAAKEQWALANGKVNGDAIVQAEVDAYIKGGNPTCPASGTYTYGAVGADPTCSIALHVLP